MPVEVVRMWPNGPLRQFSTDKARPSSTFIPYQSKTLSGHAGSYVCERCQQPADGVYIVDGQWVGGCCKG